MATWAANRDYFYGFSIGFITCLIIMMMHTYTAPLSQWLATLSDSDADGSTALSDPTPLPYAAALVPQTVNAGSCVA